MLNIFYDSMILCFSSAYAFRSKMEISGKSDVQLGRSFATALPLSLWPR